MTPNMWKKRINFDQAQVDSHIFFESNLLSDALESELAIQHMDILKHYKKVLADEIMI